MRFVLLTSSLLLLASSSVEAYIPPSRYIVKRIVQHRTSLSTLWVKSRVTLFEDGNPTGVFFDEMATMNLQTGLIRSRAFDSNGQELYARKRFFRNAATGRSRSPIVNSLFFENNPSFLTSALVSWGVPVRSQGEAMTYSTPIERRSSERTFLKRWNGHFAWGIGQDLSNPGRSQLWIRKDAFVPLRFLYPSSGGDVDQFEVNFDRFRYFKENPYPGLIRLLQGGRLVAQVELVKFALNTDLSQYQKSITNGFSSAGSSSSSELRELIENFYQFIR